MKLRFEVDQAACFRKGIDCPESIVTIEVDPQKLPEDERNLIADRLKGTDVCKLGGRRNQMHTMDGRPGLVEAETPDYQGLIAAVRRNEKFMSEQKVLEETRSRHRELVIKSAIEEGFVIPQFAKKEISFRERMAELQIALVKKIFHRRGPRQASDPA